MLFALHERPLRLPARLPDVNLTGVLLQCPWCTSPIGGVLLQQSGQPGDDLRMLVLHIRLLAHVVGHVIKLNRRQSALVVTSRSRVTPAAGTGAEFELPL